LEAGFHTTSQLNCSICLLLSARWMERGTSPSMLVNWYANKRGNMLTFPIAVSVAKVIKVGPLPKELPYSAVCAGTS